jgi:GGDEF domain-containing protein
MPAIAAGTAAADYSSWRTVAGRHGGEEFGVILPNTPLAVAKIAAERIRAAMTATTVSRNAVF